MKTVRINQIISTSLSIIFLALLCTSACGDIVYVDYQAPGPTHDGVSWNNAYLELQPALDDASSGDQIWIARGTYKPTVMHGGTTPRHRSFQLKNGVEIYGGFDPTVHADEFHERNVVYHVGRLSGDIGVEGDTSDNCFHVLYHPADLGLDSTAVMDGVTVEYGYADGSAGHESNGGGMYNEGCSPTVRSCDFAKNHASGKGGGIFNQFDANGLYRSCTIWQNTADRGAGMYNDDSDPVISNCTFNDNTASEYGGGIENINYCDIDISNCYFNSNTAGDGGGGIANWWHSSPEITDCIFNSNSAGNDGGGLFNYMVSAPTVRDCVFKGNRATETNSDGGGIYNGYGSCPTIVNCLIYYNYAHNGGGIFNWWDDICSATITNCTVFGNISATGGGLHNNEASPNVANCIFWRNGPVQILNEEGSSPTVSFCDVEDGYPGISNLNADPDFIAVPVFVDRTIAVGTMMSFSVADASLYSVGDAIEIDDSLFTYSIDSIDLSANTITFFPPAYERVGANRVISYWGDPMMMPMYGYGEEDFHIPDASPCTDRGDNTATGIPTLDFENQPRIVDGDGDGTSTVDIGADEYFEGALFVDEDATGMNNGASWTDAFTDIQSALDIATRDDEIWVAEGTYKPSSRTEPADPKSATFQLKGGVAVYGGFDPGSGVVDFAARDWDTYETVLSGDIGTPGEVGDNCYHVLYHPLGTDLGSSSILDGFTVRDGYAYGLSSLDDAHGAGMFNDRSSPRIDNCEFINNNAAANGGGIYNTNTSAPQLTNCIFEDNDADNGGGIYNEDSSPRLTNCTIGTDLHGNTADFGAGMYNLNSYPNVNDCRFSYNDAENGGGVYNENSAPVFTTCTFDRNEVNGASMHRKGGGMASFNGSAPILTDCTFTLNIAMGDAQGKGGGMYFDSTSGGTVSACRFENNISRHNGGAIYCDGGTPVINDGTVFYSNTAHTGSGGAIYCVSSAAPSLDDCTLEENDAGDNGGAVYCEDSAPIFNDCTIINNEATGYGGAIACYDDSDARFTDCDISDNSTIAVGTMGGGIYCNMSSPLIANCTLTGNTTKIGGAITCEDLASPTITHSIIMDNTAVSDAGGIFCVNNSSPEIINCIIANNHVSTGASGYGEGGGMYVATTSAPVLTNCTIAYNDAASSTGGLYSFLGSISLVNCIVWGNTGDQLYGDSITADYSDVQGSYPGTLNLNVDPDFADSASGDYHLLSGSDCIEQGDNAAVTAAGILLDIDGEDRITEGTVDIGADEYLSGVAKSDIDDDSDVDLSDYSIFGRAWLTEHGDPLWNPACDISLPKDNVVDLNDFVIMMEHWLTGTVE